MSAETANSKPTAPRAGLSRSIIFLTAAGILTIGWVALLAWCGLAIIGF
jgi:hypothetical protein